MSPSDSPNYKNFKEKITSFFMKNLLKFAALILTFLIWGAIRNQFQISKAVNVRVSVQTQKGEIPLGTATPEKVTVFLQGSKSMLEDLSGSDLKIALNTDQAERKEKICIWHLRSSDVQVPIPLGIRVKGIEPDRVAMTLDRTEAKKLKVEAVLDETRLPRGYKIGKVTVEPEEVVVTAPASKLEKLKTIRTLPIPLENITHSFDCDQSFDTESYSNIDFDRKNVLVQVEILRALKTRTFNTLPVRILIPPASKHQTMACEIVSSPTVDLEVSGAEDVINALRKEDIFVFANISDFQNPGLYWIDLRCAIDKNGITSFLINPQKISVKLERISKR
ncbi:MAG: hypothetical protein J5858_04125 [Lentisphaeria bacterium]|nr:hypothetical protein [Lentisphaeria bacterium]